MATLEEQLGASDTQIHDALVAGLEVLDQHQVVSFVPYIRTVLPVDGFVFWLNAALLPAEKLAAHGLASADPVEVPGSLHYASIGHMVEDETIAVRRVDFAAESQITAFAEIAPEVMYVGSWGTGLGTFRFTFSQRSTFYEQAKIYHYVGDAVYPAFETQLIDSMAGFEQRPVVSNSLPLWLAMMQEVPYVTLVTVPSLQLYPAYFVPPNLPPPYGAVDIPTNTTRALQSFARLGPTMSRSQLVTERVRITLYGLRNDEASDFLDYAVDYCTNIGAFGIMNMPVIQDDRRTQVELAALAQKKVIEFEISYNQTRARDIARQLIQMATATVIGSDKPLVPQPPPFIIGPLENWG